MTTSVGASAQVDYLVESILNPNKAVKEGYHAVKVTTKAGAVIAELATCEDADDVFFDARRKRIYVSCGVGVVDVFERDEASTRPLGRVSTHAGARTSLFVPELDRLFVAVPARLPGSDASVLELRTVP